MGDSSNRKLEETQENQHQLQDENKKLMMIEDVGDSRPANEFIKERDIGDDDTADNNDAISNEEKSYQMKGSREMVEEKEVSESIVERIEPVVPLSNDLNEAAVKLPIASAVSDPKETKEKPNLEKIEGKTALVLSESNGLSLEETKLSNTTEKNESSSIAVIDAGASKGIEETDLSDEKKPIEGTGLAIFKDNNKGSYQVLLMKVEIKMLNQVMQVMNLRCLKFLKTLKIIHLLYLSLDVPCKQLLHGEVVVESSTFCDTLADDSRKGGIIIHQEGRVSIPNEKDEIYQIIASYLLCAWGD